MRTTSAIVGQCLPDVAISRRGDIRAVLGIMRVNGLSITSPLSPGQELQLPSDYYNRQVAEYFSGVGINPATAAYEEPDYNPGTLRVEPLPIINLHTTTKVVSGQSFLDITMQVAGDQRAIIDLLLANDLSITDTLSPGVVVTRAESKYYSSDVVDYYKGNGHSPATAPESPTETYADSGYVDIYYWL